MLTYTEVSYFDDVLVDCLVDKVFYWASTRKTREYKPIRGVTITQILDLLRRVTTVQGRNHKPILAATSAQFLEFKPIRVFLGRFQSSQHRIEFERHLRRYLSIYLPDCGFGIEVTDRYRARSNRNEACVVARRPFLPGQEIRYLSGILVELTDQEEADLNDGRDFSIINSSRLGANCLMLGPARFVNHDCAANARFMPSGKLMLIHAKRPIAIGEEITVEYSKNYFGTNNRECLCATCELLGINGHRQNGDILEEEDGAVGEEIELHDTKQSMTARVAGAGATAGGDDGIVAPDGANIAEGADDHPSSLGNGTPSSPSLDATLEAASSSLYPHQTTPAANASVDPLAIPWPPQKPLFPARISISSLIESAPSRDSPSSASPLSSVSSVSSRSPSSERSPSLATPPTSSEPEPSEPGRSLRPRKLSAPPVVVDTVVDYDRVADRLKQYFSEPFGNPPVETLKGTCVNCHVPFFKADRGMQSRRQVCMRCFRHFQLYQSSWPKMVPASLELYYSSDREGENNHSDASESSDADSDNDTNNSGRAPIARPQAKKRQLAPAVPDELPQKRRRSASAWVLRRQKEDPMPNEARPKRPVGRPPKSLASNRTGAPQKGAVSAKPKPETPTRVSHRLKQLHLVERSPRLRKPTWKVLESEP